MIIPFGLAMSLNAFILSVILGTIKFISNNNVHSTFTRVCGLVAIVSICFAIIELYRIRRDKMLKNTGTAYDVTEIEVCRGFFGKVRGFNVFYLKGYYIDNDGSRKNVESKKYITLKETSEIFLNTGKNISKERLYAKVYKNPNDVNDYYVGVFLK